MWPERKQEININLLSKKRPNTQEFPSKKCSIVKIEHGKWSGDVSDVDDVVVVVDDDDDDDDDDDAWSWLQCLDVTSTCYRNG